MMNRRQFLSGSASLLLAANARADQLDDLYDHAIVIGSLSIE